MASSEAYLHFILEQFDGLEGITFRKMMGEYLLYFRGKVFGGIYDDRFLVKVTNASKRLMPLAKEELPYPGAKPMLLVEQVDDRTFLKKLPVELYDELPEPGKRSRTK